MRELGLFSGGPPRCIVALGAHADDIEIGCGGTLLRLIEEHPAVEVTWVVFCSDATRAAEARASADAFLAGASKRQVIVKEFRDGYLPYTGAIVKDVFEELKKVVTPDMVLTHYRDDRHQDHRTISDLSWNTWRNHLVLEYEIPKYDGDFGSPNFFSRLSARTVEKKIELIGTHFASQRSKHWFNPDLFRGVAQIRGMECVAPDGYAEGFYCRKTLV